MVKRFTLISIVILVALLAVPLLAAGTGSWGGEYGSWAGGTIIWAGDYGSWAGGTIIWAGSYAAWAGGMIIWAGGGFWGD
ncbi:MAG TPA: hypothetical protein VJG32_10475 [Anaerolineae bacterium]|nr:hypothetical protein [Anaerolineae bacterium]